MTAMPTIINALGEFVDASEPRMMVLTPVDILHVRSEIEKSEEKKPLYGYGFCERCGAKFASRKHKSQRYCSRKCAAKAMSERRKKASA